MYWIANECFNIQQPKFIIMFSNIVHSLREVVVSRGWQGIETADRGPGLSVVCWSGGRSRPASAAPPPSSHPPPPRRPCRPPTMPPARRPPWLQRWRWRWVLLQLVLQVPRWLGPLASQRLHRRAVTWLGEIKHSISNTQPGWLQWTHYKTLGLKIFTINTIQFKVMVIFSSHLYMVSCYSLDMFCGVILWVKTKTYFTNYEHESKVNIFFLYVWLSGFYK